ncbi:hypothetical protein AX17_002011 [Amanita inopinata Kibby_2008]|nr:hypothetical protein AX17_002011 [Amanita inopinata Kibby_2008]
MPPLVENQNAVMTCTFSTEITPASFLPQSVAVAGITSSINTSPPSTSNPDSWSCSITTTSTSSSTTTTAAATAVRDRRRLSPPLPMPPTKHTRSSHSKKRDASYIPRPPNAFILFRSFFIRSQQVPGKVEGNHSTLSKIIGKYWKALPREEREKWELEAVAAQAEHRRKYPDWRFRPGANAAISKPRTRDGGTAAARKRTARNRVKGGASDEQQPQDRSGDSAYYDMPEHGQGRVRDKGKGKGKARAVKERSSEEEEERLAKIANLLVQGKKGRELEIAVEEWEDDRRRMNVRSVGGGGGSGKQEESVGLGLGAEMDAMNAMDSGGESSHAGPGVAAATTPQHQHQQRHHQQQQPTNAAHLHPNVIPTQGDVDVDAGGGGGGEGGGRQEGSEFGKIPLTHWFRRSQSEPASAPRLSPAGSPDRLSVGDVAVSNEVSSPSITAAPIAAVGAGTTAAAAAGGPQETWWSSTSPPLSAAGTPEELFDSGTLMDSFDGGTAGLGYEGLEMSPFDQDHIARFQAPSLDSPDDGSAALGWTKTAGGYVAAVRDPFMDKRGGGGTKVLDPLSAIAMQPSPSTAHHHPHHHLLYTHTHTHTHPHAHRREGQARNPGSPPSSSFSSLADWAGNVSVGPALGEDNASTSHNSFGLDHGAGYGELRFRYYGVIGEGEGEGEGECDWGDGFS